LCAGGATHSGDADGRFFTHRLLCYTSGYSLHKHSDLYSLDRQGSTLSFLRAV
jgi:hypothetical protein